MAGWLEVGVAFVRVLPGNWISGDEDQEETTGIRLLCETARLSYVRHGGKGWKP